MKVRNVSLWLDGIPVEDGRHPATILSDLGITYAHWEGIPVCGMIRVSDCDVPEDIQLPEFIRVNY